tara:strand:+ start:255 stop:518 length:264 start_codon:yes stop_codon:yes gene_type:complete
MEEEQKEILDGVIIDLTKIGSLERELFAGAFGDILDKFPGKDKISFKWFTHHPSTEEPILNIATCDDGAVDADNPELYEYIFNLIHS